MKNFILGLLAVALSFTQVSAMPGVAQSGQSARGGDAVILPESTAPGGAVNFTSTQYGSTSGSILVPSVTLGQGGGNWTLGLITKIPVATSGSDYTSGEILSVHSASNTALNDSGALDLFWMGQNIVPIATKNPPFYQRSLTLFGHDDSGVSLSARGVQSSGFNGPTWQVVPGSSTTTISNASPLLGHGNGFGEGVPTLLVVERVGGIIKFLKATAHGVVLMDQSGVGTAFAGITNKPMVIGGPNWSGITGQPHQQWGQPIQQVFNWNGGAASDAQLERIAQGVDVRTVLPMSAAELDDYWPGALANGTTLTELIRGNNGTVQFDSGGSSGISQATSLLPSVSDNVTLPQITTPYVFSYQYNSSGVLTSTIKVPVRRVGGPANIRVQLVTPGSAFPTPTANVIVPWTAVGSQITNGTTTAVMVPSVPSMKQFDVDISWTNASGTFNAGYRAGITAEAGFVDVPSGQSIRQKRRDEQALTARSFSPLVSGHYYAYYDLPNIGGSGGYMSLTDDGEQQGYQQQSMPIAPSTTNKNFGEMREAQQFMLMTGLSLGIASPAVGSQSITYYLANGGANELWTREAHMISSTSPDEIEWQNGQADSAMTQAQRFAALNSLLALQEAAVMAEPGGPSNYVMAVTPCGNDFLATGGCPQSLRVIDQAWAAQSLSTLQAISPHLVGVYAQAPTLDAATQDGTHRTDDDNGLGRDADEWAQFSAWIAGKATHNDSGGQITGGTYSVSGSVTTLNLAVTTPGTKLTMGGGSNPPPLLASFDGGSTYSAPATYGLDSTGKIPVATWNTAAGANGVKFTYNAGRPGTFTVSSGGTTRASSAVDNMYYDNEASTYGILATVLRISGSGPGVAGGVSGFPIDAVNSPMSASSGTTVAIAADAATLTTATPTSPNAYSSVTYTASFTGVAPASLGYAYDGGTTYTPCAAQTTSGGNVTCKAVAPTTTGSHTVTIADLAEPSIKSTSASFSVTAAPVPSRVQTKSLLANGTLTFSATPTSGNNVILVQMSYNKYGTAPSGFSTLGQYTSNGEYISVWQSPASSVTGGITISGSDSTAITYGYETTAQYFDAPVFAFTSNGSASMSLPVGAQSRAPSGAQRDFLAFFYQSQASAISATGGTVISSNTGTGGAGSNVYLSVADGSTTNVVVTNSGSNNESGCVYVTLNGYLQ